MVYISILNQEEVTDDATYLNLRVIRTSGIQVVPDVKINVTDLNNEEGYKYKHFFNSGDGGITFKIDIIILEDDMIGDYYVTDYINELFVNMLPVSVVTNALDIPNDTYIITKNTNRKQTYDESTIWSLEFATYVPLNLFKYKNNNSAVLNALKERKNANKKKTTTTASTPYSKLKKCNYKVLVYSKKKKIVSCVKYLQQVLYKKKLLNKNQIDGWYGDVTKNAVKKYQQQYNKKYKVTNIAQKNSGGIFGVTAGKLIQGQKNKTTIVKTKPKISKRLNVTGKVDKATWTALCKGE